MEKKIPSRNQIKIGQRVWAIEKRNYGSGELTEGRVKKILTPKPNHSRGIKVMFEDGIVARVQRLTFEHSEKASGLKPRPSPEKGGSTVTQNMPTKEDLI